jgi:hypothetical protein
MRSLMMIKKERMMVTKRCFCFLLWNEVAVSSNQNGLKIQISTNSWRIQNFSERRTFWTDDVVIHSIFGSSYASINFFINSAALNTPS